MTKTLTRPLFLLVILSCVIGTCLAEEKTSTTTKALFTADAYMTHLRYLAGDELGGRLPGTPGGRATTEYIADQFEKIGLKPAGVDGTYFQPFTIRRLKKLHEDQADFSVSGLEHDWTIRRDWIPMPFSKPGKIEGPLAFAGYGISASKYDYNDYADFDPEGKVLLILRHEPKDDDPDADFGGETPSRYALFSKKALTAAEKGAKALLIVNAPNRNPDEDLLYPWHDWDTHQSYSLPIVHISREIADAVLKQADLPDLKTLQENLDRDRKPLSADLPGINVNIKTGVKYVKGRNVIGLLEGTDSDELIVLGAHHDHLGKVPPRMGDSREPAIHNGADDNASGSSAILEFARVFADGPRPRRGIIFMTFDGEELGLLGSRYFVDHPTVDIKKIRAMINFDMIGRLNLDRFTVFGVGSGKEFRALLDESAEKLDLSFHAPRTDSRFFGGADHFPFYVKDIPAMFAFTGIHKQYHMPDDDWELIDAEGAIKVIQLMYPVINELANMTDGPIFVTKEEERERAEARKAVEVPDDTPKDVDVADETPDPRSNRGGGQRVRVGVIPDHAYDGVGLRVHTIVENAPAAKAGLKDGDIIVRIAGETVADIGTYMDALKPHKPGDEVEVVVKRGDKQLTLKVKLEQSRRRRNPEND